VRTRAICVSKPVADRQWDPPKLPCRVVRFRGKDNDGISIVSYHFKDWRGATESVVAPSDFDPDTVFLAQTPSSAVNAPVHSVDIPATLNERVALEALTMMAGGRSRRCVACIAPLPLSDLCTFAHLGNQSALSHRAIRPLPLRGVNRATRSAS
jgi:hypothetical protein